MKSRVCTDPRKAKYYRLPSYFRAFAYFCIRYFLKLGFLDGLSGFRWHFSALASLGVFASPRVANPRKGRLRQGLWYRLLVDREISCLKHQN